MRFPSSLKQKVSPQFLRSWENTIRLTTELLNRDSTHDHVDEILVEAFWWYNGKSWIEQPDVLKGLIGNQLDIIHRCLGQNASARLTSSLNRLRGSNLTPRDDFWNDLSNEIISNPRTKTRLMNSIQPANEHTSEEDAYMTGIEILKNKPFVLRQYQLEMIDQIYSEIVNGQERIMLKLPTGSGKTRIALDAIYKLMFERYVNVVIWIADERQLCEQAVDSAKVAFQNSTQGLDELILVSFFDSNALTDLGAIRNSNDAKMLIVCTPDQLSGNLDLLPEADLFVMDEAHTSVNQRFDLYRSSGANTILGLSATPPPHWIETKQLTPRTSFDSTRMSTLDFLRHEGVLSNAQYSVRTMVEEIDYEEVTRLIGGNRSAKFNDPFVTFSILSNLIQDLENNQVDSPIVFVDRVEQAAILSAAFNKLMPEYNSAFIEGRTPKTRRHAILQQFRNGTIHVLFNVNMLREGFDSPNIDGVYLAMINNPDKTSTKYIQMVGRGLRGTASEGGTESCHVVTIDYSYE